MASPTFGAAAAQNSASATTISFAIPAGTAANEVVLLLVYNESTTNTLTCTGFTAKGTATVTGGGAHRLWCFWKRCTTTDTGTYDVAGNTGSPYIEGIAVRWSGCITTGDPFDQFTSGVLTSSGTSPSLSVTTTQTDELLIYAATNFNGGAWTPPSGFTERVDYSGDVTVDSLPQASPGTFGPYSASCAGGATGTCGILASLLSTTSSSGGGAAVPYAPRQQMASPVAALAAWLQRDRRDANTVASAGAAPDIPAGTARTVLARNPGGSYWAQARRQSEPSQLGTALLEVSAPGRPSPATRDPGETYYSQRPARADQSTPAGAAFDPVLAGTLTARLTPATNGDRRLVPGQPARPAQIAAPVAPVLIGAGAASGWWSADDDREHITGNRPRVSDPSLLAPAGTSFDPTQAGQPPAARLTPATHADRRQRPQQRRARGGGTAAAATQIGTGQAGAWWSADDTVAYLAGNPARSTVPAAAAGSPFDPLLAAYAVAMAARTPVTHGDRRRAGQQRPALSPGDAPPVVVALIGTGATGAWWSIDDTAHYGPAQRGPRIDVGTPPVSTPADPVLAAYLPRWLAANTAATHDDRRLFPGQRTALAAPDDGFVTVGSGALVVWWGDDPAVAYIAAERPRRSVPAAVAGTPFDPLLAATLVQLVARTPVTHVDRRSVPQQRPALAGQFTAPAVVALIGTGALNAWWSADDLTAYLTGQRPTRTPGLTDPAGTPSDPTQAGYGWAAGLVAATHAGRRLIPQQRLALADQSNLPGVPLDPTLAGWLPALVARIWAADRREYPAQRPQLADQSVTPVFTAADPTLLAYLTSRTALTWATDRREVPLQGPRIDPALYAQALLEDALLGSADDLARHRMWFTDRRLVPAQLKGHHRGSAPTPADPLTLNGELTKRANQAATHYARWVLRTWRQALADVTTAPAPAGPQDASHEWADLIERTRTWMELY